MLLLRVLGTSDWPVWRDVRLAALSDAPEAFKPRLADWRRGGEDEWGARLHLPGAHNVVAELDGHAVGIVRGVPIDEVSGELRSLWVAPQARGRGVADRLIRSVEAWARRSGVSRLELSVLPDNAPALALYERHGFVRKEERGDVPPEPGDREIAMTKPLPLTPSASTI
ncbi:hypothetical protein N566_17595 [Streptomycetaceae bacterium MP113-05]|nr:hypothetical protein N566_17595 [Streptomycetaceae bacterium MP113-05]